MVRHDARCHLQKKGVLFALVTAPHCMAWRHSHCSVGQGAETPQHDVAMSNQLFQVQQKAAQHLGPMGALCALVVCQKHCDEVMEAEHNLLARGAALRAREDHTVTLEHHEFL